MISRVEKIDQNFTCPHCGETTESIWIITYRSYQYLRYVYLCGVCTRVLKVTRERDADETFCPPPPNHGVSPQPSHP